MSDLVYSFSEMIFTGCFPSTVHDQLAGELVKARLMKASGRYDEALAVINKTLKRIPGDEKKKCKTEKEKTIRRWSEGFLKEMQQERRAQHKRKRRDMGELD
jgi:phage-related tail protein